MARIEFTSSGSGDIQYAPIPQGTYDLSVTGEKKDGTPFTHEAKAVNFETKKTTMDSLLILTGRQINAYVGEISLQSQ